MTSQATPADIVAAFAYVVDTVAGRYGPRSQAALIAKYEFLLTLLDLRHRSDFNPGLSDLVEGLVADLQHHYRTSAINLGGSSYCRVISDSPPLIEYDRDYYELRYSRTGEKVRNALIEVMRSTATHLQRLKPYVYVIDEAERLIVYRVPLRLDDVVLGRNPAVAYEEMVFHPMLVHQALKVRVAGEITFIGSPDIVAAIANTKSGHFKPPPSTGEVLQRVLQRDLGLAPDDVVVFTVFGASIAESPGTVSRS